MKVRTPNFIIYECERLIETLPHEHKEEAKAILEQLCKMNTLEEAVRMMEHMSEMEKAYVYPRMEPQLFKRSLVSKSLIRVVKQYKNREDAEDVLNVVQKMARFEENLCQDDAVCEWDRTFNVVTSPTEWKRICARSKVFPGKGSIKIALEIKQPKKTMTADKSWQRAVLNLQMYTFAELDYEIWFRQVDRAIYYIYLPSKKNSRQL